MYREITLHDLQVRVYRDGKTIQVLRCNGWVNLKYKRISWLSYDYFKEELIKENPIK